MMPPPVPYAPIARPAPIPAPVPAYELPALSSFPIASGAVAASSAAQVAQQEPPPLPWETAAVTVAPNPLPDSISDSPLDPLPLQSISGEPSGASRGEAI